MNTPNNSQDRLLKSLFKEVAIENGGSITEQVMQNIQHLPSAEPVKYQPPISRKGWVIFISFFAVLLIYTAMIDSTLTINLPSFSYDLSMLLDRFQNSFTFKLEIPSLPNFSGTYLTSLFAFIVIGLYFMVSYRGTRRV